MEKYINLVVFLFFFLSIFYLIKNIFLSEETNYRNLIAYKKSLKNLNKFIQIENKKNEQLQNLYVRLMTNQTEYIEIYVENQLLLISPCSRVFLKENTLK